MPGTCSRQPASSKNLMTSSMCTTLSPSVKMTMMLCINLMRGKINKKDPPYQSIAAPKPSQKIQV